MSVQAFQYADKPKGATITSERKTNVSNTPGPLPTIIEESGVKNRTNSASNFTYQYGIKNISLTHSLYEQAGVFVSKPIEVEGNIVEVSLSTVEDHPHFNELDGMATDRVTSIEYYVSLEENPSTNDWVAILPEETKVVKCEKLFLQGSSATLRFHADIHQVENTNVYKNNILLNKSDWYFTNRGASIQFSVAPDRNAIYTIDYVPDTAISSPWTIQAGERFAKRSRRLESFENGTDFNNTLKLSKYPYVDYETINGTSNYDPNTNEYRPIEVFLRDGSIAAGNGKTQKEFPPVAYTDRKEFITLNRTDYKNNKDVSLNKYSIVPGEEYKVMEYKQEKNKLVFTESFNRSNLYYNEATNHGNARIDVYYDYLVTNFRLKIILRKNTGDDLIVTPMVNSYQLKFKVMK